MRSANPSVCAEAFGGWNARSKEAIITWRVVVTSRGNPGLLGGEGSEQRGATAVIMLSPRGTSIVMCIRINSLCLDSDTGMTIDVLKMANKHKLHYCLPAEIST